MGVFGLKLPKKVNNAIGAVERGVSRGVAQVNPLDNGRTWQNNNPQNNQSVAQQARPLIQNARNVIESPIKPTSSILANANYDLARAGVAAVTNNDTARNNALKAFKSDYTPAVETGRSFVTRPIVQVASTLAKPTLDNNISYNPTNSATKFLLGDKPVQSVQAGVRSNYRAHGDLPIAQRLALAGAYGAGQLAQDAPVGTGALKGVKVVSKEATPVVRAVAATQKPLNEAGFIAGPKALGFKEAKAQGKTFIGPEGKPQFEVSDQGMTLKPIVKQRSHGAITTLGEAIDHPKLFENYPHLKDMQVKIGNTGDRSIGGGYSRTNKNIGINKNWSVKGKDETALHETQHAIQHIEDFQRGGGEARVRHIAEERIKAMPEGAIRSDRAIRGHHIALDVVRKQLRDGGFSGFYDKNGNIKGSVNIELKPLADQHDSLLGGLKAEYKKPSKEMIRHQTYQDIFGENQARTVVNRRNMTDAQRQAKPFYANMDRDPINAIMHNGLPDPLGKYSPIDKTTKERIMNLKGDGNGVQQPKRVKVTRKTTEKVTETGKGKTTVSKVTEKTQPTEVKVKGIPRAERQGITKTFGVSPGTAAKDIVDTKAAKLGATGRKVTKPGDGTVVPPEIKQQLEAPTAPDTGLNAPEVNTAKNPFKAPIPEVKAGDYKQIVSNEQTASNPTMVAGNRWQLAMGKLKKANPDEYSNFWRHVEDTGSAKSPELQKAVDAWRRVDDRIHGTSQKLGGNTNYLTDHGLHPWNLPDDIAKHLASGGDIQRFPGINSSARKYRTIAEGEANGLTLGNNPLEEGSKYIQASAGSLRRRAIIKGLGEADGHIPDKTHFLDLGKGETVPMSKEAHDALKGLQKERYSDNPAIKGARTVNQALRTTILSGGQFHPINISVLRAGPSLATAGHPVRAVKGVVGTFTATKGRVSKMYENALTDTVKDPGTNQAMTYVDAAAKIGSPYAQKGYETAGSSLKSGVGHKLVFEQQIPMMHDQVVRGVLDDLIRKGVPLDSEAARQAGVAANSTMGFINKEALNIPKSVRKGMSDWMLASQFTPSKIVTVSKVGKSGVAGKYARADIVSNVAAATALITGVGYLMGQKSDNVRDSLLRALVNPAIPTPMKDKKGNNTELRLPLTYTGEIAKILGMNLKRGEDGHLSVEWNPEKTFSPHSGLAEWARSRLAPVQSTALKIATNTNFADKPLSDPNANAGTRAIQAATTIGQGMLPIGAQGIPYTKVVKDHLPQTARDILENNTPGNNPLVKSLASSAGFSPRTDQTTGKALGTAQYFDARDKFAGSLNPDEKAIFDKIAAPKKDSFGNKTKPDTKLTKVADYGDLVANQAFADKYHAYQKSQKNHDPLWDLDNSQLRSYMQAQVISKNDPGGDSTTVRKLYDRLPEGFFASRDKYFEGLKKGGAKFDESKFNSKPGMPSDLVKFSNDYHNMPYGTGVRSSALRSEKGQKYIAWLNQNKVYTNQERADLGLPPLEDTSKTYASSGKSSGSGGKKSYSNSGSSSSTKTTKSYLKSSYGSKRITIYKNKARAPKVTVRARNTGSGKIKTTTKKIRLA